jgi:hypothetical protein
MAVVIVNRATIAQSASIVAQAVYAECVQQKQSLKPKNNLHEKILLT